MFVKAKEKSYSNSSSTNPRNVLLSVRTSGRSDISMNKEAGEEVLRHLSIMEREVSVTYTFLVSNDKEAERS